MPTMPAPSESAMETQAAAATVAAANESLPSVPSEASAQASSSSSTNVDGETSGGDAEAVRRDLAEERMNQTRHLPECTCIQQPRVVSYAEVGDPDGYVAFFILGVDSHRYMSLLFDKLAKARGVRLICLDRPGRGTSSDFEDKRTNRILEFPAILRHFCRAEGIRFFSLVGQSLGATYALRCAQKMPDMVATTVYLVSPWVPLSVPGTSRALAAVQKLPAWLISGAMAMGTAMPRLLAATGSLSLMARACSEEEGLLFASPMFAQVLTAVARAKEASHAVILDSLAALEKNEPLGFDYREVSMPVHIFHGRADHMVPFPAVQWLSQEMPACTASVKMGGTHALVMDAGVLDCVLECMCEDFKRFMEHPANASTSEEAARADRGPAFSFPAHTQHFQAHGHLRCREGMLVKSWENRYFILEGYQLSEFDGPDSATARRVVDLRGILALITGDGAKMNALDQRNPAFLFKITNSKYRVLYELGASSAEDRAFWVEILTKASRFSIGSGDEERKGALSRRFLVTTRVGSRRREVLGERRGAINSGDSSSGVGGGVGGDARRDETVAVARRQSASFGANTSLATSVDKVFLTSPLPLEIQTIREGIDASSDRASSPGAVASRKNKSRGLLHEAPFRKSWSFSAGRRQIQRAEMNPE